MTWILLVENFQFLSGSATSREWRTTLQNFGMKVKDVIYAVEVLNASDSSGITVAIRHDQGASPNLNMMATLDTPISTSSFTAPTTLNGVVVPDTAGQGLLPYFMPTVIITSDSGIKWVRANIYVGGKPF